MLPIAERPDLPHISPKIVPQLLAAISKIEKFLPGTNVWPNSKAIPRGIIRSAHTRLLFLSPKAKKGRKESQR
jgi:hypothetical protein